MQLQTKESPPDELILTPWIKTLPLKFMLHVKIPPFLSLVGIVYQITPLLKVFDVCSRVWVVGGRAERSWSCLPTLQMWEIVPWIFFVSHFLSLKRQGGIHPNPSLGRLHLLSKANKEYDGHAFGLLLPLRLSFNQYLLLSHVFLPFGIKKQLLSLNSQISEHILFYPCLYTFLSPALSGNTLLC